MNKKERQMEIAFEALVVLVTLALLSFICRLWPILLLIMLGIMAAALRLIFLSSKKIPTVEPRPLLPEPAKKHTEKDVRDMAYAVILNRITELVTDEYPCARWVWESPNPREQMEQGESVFILLNHAGGYRRAKVTVSNLQVTGLEYRSVPIPDIPEPEPPEPKPEDSPPKENYELLAFEWVSANLMELDRRCNEAIGSGCSELIVPEAELPVRESWEDICRELRRNGLDDIDSLPEGIKIHLKSEQKEGITE